MDNGKAKMDVSVVWECHALSTRESANSLFETAIREKSTFCKNDELEFDLNGISHISRSFADEFAKNGNILKNTSGVTVSAKNACSEVMKILQVVKRSQIKKKRGPTEEFDRLTFTDATSLEEFLAPM